MGRQQLILPLIQTAAASDADSSLDVKLNQEEPRKSIPWGTLKIILIVLVVLVILAFSSQASCSSTQKKNGKNSAAEERGCGSGTCAGSAGRSTP